MAMPTPKPGLPNGENQPLQAAVLDDADSSLGNDAASSTASITSSILRYRTLNGRTYHSDRGSSLYWGANDDAQNTMLDIQHHVFTLVLDGKLYLAPLPEEVNKVLDIGTGTGLWVLDFADQHPQATIIGTDLSPIQPTWVPPNARFEIDDLAEPWTFDEASVDYVHIRWLIGSVRDWPALFKEAYRVLKPGGWIESFECNGLFESDDDSIPEDSATSQWNDIFGAGAKTLGSSFTVVHDGVLQRSLEEAGFPRIKESPFKIPFSEWPQDPKLKEIGLFARHVFENDIEGSVGLLATMLGWSKDEISVFGARLCRDMRCMDVHAFYWCNVIWAQKPFHA